MKKVLCYFGILILLGLVLMPPMLRITLPKENKEDKNEVVSSRLLSCQNEELIIKQSYENNKVKMIVIKKLLVENDEYIKSKELIRIFDSIKENSNITYNKLEDGEVISIDFSISEHNDLNINSMTQEISGVLEVKGAAIEASS